jgi:RNA polymerase sigma factor (sigma-70 family)
MVETKRQPDSFKIFDKVYFRLSHDSGNSIDRMSNSPADDELLKRYVRDGAQEAFAALVERYLSLVYGVALRRLHDPTPAQEVTQKVFITLARQAVWLTGHASLGGWLYRATLNLAQHEWRSEQRRRKREEIALELGTTMRTDESLLSTIAPLLDEAMLELRMADREALLLRFFANKSLRDVGAALGIQEDAAQKRVSKALDALAERFRQRGFRVAGTAALALALQQSSAHALPAGLALSTTSAAITAGAGASLGGMTMPIVKLMSLTKLQTAALCVTIAAVPLGYQWHALGNARSMNEQTTSQLQGLRTQAFAHERTQAQAERRLAKAKSGLSQSTPNARVSANAKYGQEENLYVWDEHSPYIRLPKNILSQLHFAPYGTRMRRDGKVEQYQLPPLAADGSPQPALAAALGLSPGEAQQLSALCQNEFTEFNTLAASHSQLTEQPFAGGAMKSAVLDTSAFADEGAQFRDQFKGEVTSLLGSERADAFWQQATPVFNELFNNFGANSRKLQLVNNPNAGLELFNMSPAGGTVGSLSQRNGMPLPPQLQAYADAWSAPQDQSAPPPQ